MKLRKISKLRTSIFPRGVRGGRLRSGAAAIQRAARWLGSSCRECSQVGQLFSAMNAMTARNRIKASTRRIGLQPAAVGARFQGFGE